MDKTPRSLKRLFRRGVYGVQSPDLIDVPHNSSLPYVSSPRLKSEFQLEGWKIQPQLNSISRGSDFIRLEPKIMQVLIELASRPGEVLTKEELIHAVWPNTYVGDDALIRCISELRRTFEDDPRSPHVIQTISKIGYRLIAPVDVANGHATFASPQSISQPP